LPTPSAAADKPKIRKFNFESRDNSRNGSLAPTTPNAKHLDLKDIIEISKEFKERELKKA
jgi:hypothetical protein